MTVMLLEATPPRHHFYGIDAHLIVSVGSSKLLELEKKLFNGWTLNSKCGEFETSGAGEEATSIVTDGHLILSKGSSKLLELEKKLL
jgi:hypothetical protein